MLLRGNENVREGILCEKTTGPKIEEVLSWVDHLRKGAL